MKNFPLSDSKFYLTIGCSAYRHRVSEDRGKKLFQAANFDLLGGSAKAASQFLTTVGQVPFPLTEPNGSGVTNAASRQEPGKPERCPGAWVRKARARSKCEILLTDSLANLRAESISDSGSKCEATDRRHEGLLSKDRTRYPKGCSVFRSLPPSSIKLFLRVQVQRYVQRGLK